MEYLDDSEDAVKRVKIFLDNEAILDKDFIVRVQYFMNTATRNIQDPVEGRQIANILNAIIENKSSSWEGTEILLDESNESVFSMCHLQRMRDVAAGTNREDAPLYNSMLRGVVRKCERLAENNSNPRP